MKNNNKKFNKMILMFSVLFVVICFNALYKRSYIDIIYLLVVTFYFSKYLRLQKNL